MINVYIVPAQHLHDEWVAVKDDLAFCLAQATDEVWVEDVYHCIRAGTTLLVVLRSADWSYRGMVVITEYPEPFNPRVKSLHVWFTRTHSHEATEAGMNFLRKHAKATGCRKIAFRGARPGFARWGDEFGFKQSLIELVAEVV